MKNSEEANFGRPDASDNVICRNVSGHLQRIPLRGSTLHN
jgi:hypothetical protein